MSKQCNFVLKKIRNAEFPVILVGNGVRLAGAVKEFNRVIEKLNIPVVSGMFTATDIVPHHTPEYFGCQGMWGKKEANVLVDTCDVLLIIGDRLDMTQTSWDCESFATQAYKIMVDVDPFEMQKRNLGIDLRIRMDAKEFLNEIYRSL